MSASVLLVTDRHSVEDSIGEALIRAGYDVFQCPGPRPPGYTCVGGCGGRCALAEGCDVVVLDADLGSDAVGHGTSAWDLLRYYQRLARPVVVLAGADEVPGWYADERVTLLPHATDARSVVATVLRLLPGRSSAQPTSPPSVRATDGTNDRNRYT